MKLKDLPELDSSLGGQNNVRFKSLRPHQTHPRPNRLEGSRADRVPRSDRPDGRHLRRRGNPRHMGASDQRLARRQLGADAGAFPHSRHGGRGE